MNGSISLSVDFSDVRDAVQEAGFFVFPAGVNGLQEHIAECSQEDVTAALQEAGYLTYTTGLAGLTAHIEDLGNNDVPDVPDVLWDGLQDAGFLDGMPYLVARILSDRALLDRLVAAMGHDRRNQLIGELIVANRT